MKLYNLNTSELKLLKKLPIAIAFFDKKNLECMAYSEKWQQEYSYDLNYDLVGESFYDIFPITHDLIKADLEKALQGEVVTRENDLIKNRKGKVSYINLEFTPWYLNEKDLGGISITVEDVTCQVQYEKLKRKYELYFSELDGKGLNSEELTVYGNTSMAIVLHELEVHHAELMAQNEELEKNQAILVESQKTFEDIFRKSPVAKLLLDVQGNIKSLNHKAISLLESPYINRPTLFSYFVVQRDLGKFYLWLEERKKETLHIHLLINNKEIQVKLEGITILKDGEHLFYTTIFQM